MVWRTWIERLPRSLHPWLYVTRPKHSWNNNMLPSFWNSSGLRKSYMNSFRQRLLKFVIPHRREREREIWTQVWALTVASLRILILKTSKHLFSISFVFWDWKKKKNCIILFLGYKQFFWTRKKKKTVTKHNITVTGCRELLDCLSFDKSNFW